MQNSMMMSMEADAKMRAEKRRKRTLKGRSHKEKGNQALKQGRYEEAIEHYSAGLKIAPHITALHTNRAQAYLKLERYAEAIEDCDVLIRFPDFSVPTLVTKAHYRRALALAALKRFEEALEDAEEARKLEPKNKQLTRLCAELTEDLRRGEGAAPRDGSGYRSDALVGELAALQRAYHESTARGADDALTFLTGLRALVEVSPAGTETKAADAAVGEEDAAARGQSQLIYGYQPSALRRKMALKVVRSANVMEEVYSLLAHGVSSAAAQELETNNGKEVASPPSMLRVREAAAQLLVLLTGNKATQAKLAHAEAARALSGALIYAMQQQMVLQIGGIVQRATSEQPDSSVRAVCLMGFSCVLRKGFCLSASVGATARNCNDVPLRVLQHECITQWERGTFAVRLSCTARSGTYALRPW